MLQKSLNKQIMVKETRISRYFGDKLNIISFLLYIFSFLSATNPFGSQKYFILVTAILMCLYIYSSRVIKIDNRTVFILLFAVFYSFSVTLFNGFSLGTLFYPFFILILQQFTMVAIKLKREQDLHYLIFSFSLGFFLTYCLIVLASIRNQGLIFDGGFLTIFWDKTGNTIITRTGLSQYCIWIIPYTIVVFYNSKFKNIVNIIIACITYLFCFIMSAISGTRSLSLILIIIFGLLLLQILYRTKRKLIKNIIFGFILVSFLLSSLVLLKIIEVPESLLRITFINRLLNPDNNSNSARLELLKLLFSNFYKYPFGGLNRLDGINYAHNIYLDFYTYGGLIPFIISILFIIDFIFLLRKSKINKIFNDTKFIFYLLSFLIFNFLGLLEPLYNSNPNSFTPLFIIYFILCYTTKRETPSVVISNEILKKKGYILNFVQGNTIITIEEIINSVESLGLTYYILTDDDINLIMKDIFSDKLVKYIGFGVIITDLRGDVISRLKIKLSYLDQIFDNSVLVVISNTKIENMYFAKMKFIDYVIDETPFLNYQYNNNN